MRVRYRLQPMNNPFKKFLPKHKQPETAMSASKDDKAPEVVEPISITKAQAAQVVTRAVPVLDDKGKQRIDKKDNPVTKQEAIKADEVLNHAVYEADDKVVVVTKSGEKLIAKLSKVK